MQSETADTRKAGWPRLWFENSMRKSSLEETA